MVYLVVAVVAVVVVNTADMSRADIKWKPPHNKEVHLRKRDDKVLIINPAVPTWFVTNDLGVHIVQHFDGKKSIEDIDHEVKKMCKESNVTISNDLVKNFISSLREIGFFDPPSIRNEIFDVSGKWNTRRLSGVYLHLTNTCNLECSYCYRQSSPREKTLKTGKEIIAALEKIRPYTTNDCNITFSGGEPLMHKDFEEIAVALKRLGYKNDLLTNGILVTEEKAKFISHNFIAAKISLDSPYEATNTQFRGKNFDRVVRGIHYLHQTGIKVVVQVTVGQSNIHECKEIEELLPSKINIKYTPILPMGRGKNNTDEHISNVQFYDLNKSVSQLPLNYYQPKRASRGCHAGSYSISISDNGDVYPCHHFHSKSFFQGNIYKDDFKEIINGGSSQDIAKSFDVESNNKHCSSCAIRLVCGGGCKANTLHATGSMFGPDSHCSYLRETITDQMFNGSISRPN